MLKKGAKKSSTETSQDDVILQAREKMHRQNSTREKTTSRPLDAGLVSLLLPLLPLGRIAVDKLEEGVDDVVRNVVHAVFWC